jgi:AraC-like DNA-binding protein
MVTTCLKLKIMAPPRVDKEIESLILRLREEEKWTMEKIAQHVKMHIAVPGQK